MNLNVKGTEYKIKFGYNSFCDTDLLDRTSSLIKIFQGQEVDDDKDVFGMGKIKELFSCVRDLLFVGFQKHNPVADVKDIGNILDDYKEEETETDKRSILDLFTKLTAELMDEGFLSDLLKAMEETAETPKVPQDHKRPQKKGSTQK